ncbi:hydrophobe/amphiphile efflux family protein [Leptospirillum ferriphilum ML-04]|nr:hydrophobe/amphiphile efflux family protein [Leptospirillum ferriphilum ML-04]
MVTFFLKRPIFAGVVAIIMVLTGMIAFKLLPVSQFPRIVPPQVTVTANYPGASAQVVADTVTTPLEEVISGVPGMAYMSSNSSNDGSSTITITFKVGYPIDIAAVDVQNRISQASPQLPAIVNQGGIVIQKKNPNFVLIVNLISPDGSIDPITMSNYAYLQIVDPLKRLPGVSDAQIFGERRYSMRIWLNPDKLSRLGVTAVDVQNAIAEQNIQVAAGKIGEAPAPRGTMFEYQVNALGRLSTPEEFGNIIVKAGTTSNAAVRLRDVARIRLGSLQYTSAAHMDKNKTIVIGIFQAPGSNALDLDKAVKDKMKELSKRFPKGMTYSIKYDTTMFVSASMHEVVFTLLEALILVMIVVFLFLQSWRTMVIAGIAIPVSLIGTLAVMKIVGFSLNTVSLLGMVLAIGLVVDDAIVVVENVERQLEHGLPPMEAVRIAMGEVTGPIIATSAVLGAVFVPVGFLPGVTGELYRQFALTIAISVGLSAFNSLTLTPALSGWLLRYRGPSEIFVFRKFNEIFNTVRDGYARMIHRAIEAKWYAMGLFLGGIIMTYGLFVRVPHTFLPVEDQGYFFVIIQLPDGASLERTENVAKTVRDTLLATPGIDHVVSISGFNFLTFANQSNSAAEFAILKPWEVRGRYRTASMIVNEVRPKLLMIPAGLALAFDPPSIPGLGTTGGFEFEVEDLTGKGSKALDQATQDLIAEAKKQPEIDARQVFTTFSTQTPQLDYDLDRTKAKLLGLNLPDIFNTLQIYLGSLYVNNFNMYGRTFRVTLEADKGARKNARDLSRLYVRNTSGGMIPLDTLGKLKPTVGPETISHYNIFGSAQISGGPAPGFSSGDAITAMERAARKSLPNDFGFEWTGITYQELKVGSVEKITFGISLVFVFLFLAALYESWSMPFMVILAVPLAIFGAIFAT